MNNKIWSQLERLELKLQKTTVLDAPLLVCWDGEFLRAHSLESRRGIQLLKTMGDQVVGVFDNRISPQEFREAMFFVIDQYSLKI